MSTDFHLYNYWSPCKGCLEGHSSFWKTVIESPQWKLWQKEQRKRFGEFTKGNRNVKAYDMLEVEECGFISQDHFQNFLKFIRGIPRNDVTKPVKVEFYSKGETKLRRGARPCDAGKNAEPR